MNCTEKIHAQCQILLLESEIHTRDLIQLLQSIELTREEIHHLSEDDPSKPYGRNVLFDHPRLEVMIAKWTPESRAHHMTTRFLVQPFGCYKVVHITDCTKFKTIN